MTADDLVSVINSLAPEERQSVKQFVEFLKGNLCLHRFSQRLTSLSINTPNCSAVWPSDVLPNR